MAAKQRAAAKAVAKAEETLNRVHEPLDNANDEPAKAWSRPPPQAVARLEQVAQDVDSRSPRAPAPRRAARAGHPEHPRHRPRLPLCRLGARRASQRQAHCRGYPAHIDTIRTIAQQEHLSETCLERIEKAERVVPKMQATIEFVSGYVRQQVRQLDLAPPVSYAMHAHLIPSYYLDRVASTRTVTAGEPLRALAERLRTPLFEPGGALGALSPMEQNQLKHKAQNARGGVPALQLQCGRAQRVPLAEEPSTARTRPPQKAGMSDGRAQLFPHAS